MINAVNIPFHEIQCLFRAVRCLLLKWDSFFILLQFYKKKTPIHCLTRRCGWCLYPVYCFVWSWFSLRRLYGFCLLTQIVRIGVWINFARYARSIDLKTRYVVRALCSTNLQLPLALKGLSLVCWHVIEEHLFVSLKTVNLLLRILLYFSFLPLYSLPTPSDLISGRESSLFYRIPTPFPLPTVAKEFSLNLPLLVTSSNLF